MAEVLKMAHLAQHDGMPDVNVWCGGVQAELDSQGTSQRPVTFTALDADSPWGQIDIDSGSATFAQGSGWSDLRLTLMRPVAASI